MRKQVWCGVENNSSGKSNCYEIMSALFNYKKQGVQKMKEVYLDNAATMQKPQTVIDSSVEVYTKYFPFDNYSACGFGPVFFL